MPVHTPVVALRSEPAATQRPASERIRQRLLQACQRHHANDNIADFIAEGELDELRAEVAGRLEDVLQALVIDTRHDHNSAGTAQRVARMFIDEVFAGRYRAAPEVATFPNVSRLDQLMTIGPLTVRSACSHHLCPIMGRVWIGVLPNADSELIGLSKYARICDWVMSRPQIQEEAVTMLADALEQRVKPDGLAIVIEADHFCMHWRGVKDAHALMRNTVMRGAFAHDAGLRSEFLGFVACDAA
ncbi:MAG: GTP cyclohydrolase I [Dokdonella sp.]|uniref:GTP cyclohydrolase I n=1 Tax=Dokdonella sp. TaxID=2291710 RepID=UPI0025B7EFFF|nr:GTP cyclohydrolase I [Dokdonella sp.]MBX3699775.1 GTP cyclohydrolase I [Dokdonella sp.]